MLIPQQTYRWLISEEIIPNQGELAQKNMVLLSQSLFLRFQNGFLIAQIVKKIIRKSQQKVPNCLNNVKVQANKNVKATNWNFVWISFQQLRMHFDTRIKDLILQGETALIIEIIKQLCDRDQNKNYSLMEQIIIKQKINPKHEKAKQSQVKNSVLDLKKVNLQKNPDQSQSSLQFLILLLTSAFSMTVEEVLGLFTNQNKYLAHIIVKGINEDFTSVLLFYTLLDKHIKKLKWFCQNNAKDADSCLYAIKPGFLSKSSEVSKMTIEVFKKVGKLYEWFINEEVHGSKTIFLGIKRHPSLVEEYWQLIMKIIQNEEIQFFTTQFKKNFNDSIDLIETCTLLLRPISECYISEKLLDIGIYSDWFQICVNLFNSKNIQNKLMSYQFLGEAMTSIPKSIEQSEECLRIMKGGWKSRNFIQFTILINELIHILYRLANIRSPLASKLFHIMIQIFTNVEDDEDKRNYLIYNFISVLEEYPKIPSHYLIQAFKYKYLQQNDFMLVKIAIKNSENEENNVRIGDTLLTMFLSDPIVNYHIGTLIYEIAKKAVDDQLGQAFIKKCIKECLHKYSKYEGHSHKPNIKSKPLYFNYKGNTQKINQEENSSLKIKEKESKNFFQLSEQLTYLSKMIPQKQLQEQIKVSYLLTNSYMKKHKHNNSNITSMMKKLNISKSEEEEFEEENKLKKSLLEESFIHKTKLSNYQHTSRFTGPAYLRKEFQEKIRKRKMQEEYKVIEEERKQRDERVKKENLQRQLRKLKLLKGYVGVEGQLKEEGYWESRLKQDKQLEVYHPSLIEERDLQFMQYTLKKYHRVNRFIFLKYTSSMYSVKNISNFQENNNRKQIITSVQLLKFLKDYKLAFLTTNNDVQQLVRDINLKIFNKRQNSELDFHGFQQFIMQFSFLFLTKPHTLSSTTTTKNSKNSQTKLKSLKHLTHSQVLQEFFKYLKVVFMEKGEKTIMFEEPEAAYFNEAQVIKEFSKKIEQDPEFVLPEGYKKISEKYPEYNNKISNNIVLNEQYVDCLQILDQVIYSSLNFHFLEPIIQKKTKTRVKPHAFLNIKPKINQIEESKGRVFSSITQRKAPAIPPMKMLQRKVLSFGMKLGLSYVSYKDKLLGEQVAYVLDDMLTAVQTGKQTIEKEKIMNDAMKKRKQQKQKEKKELQNKEQKLKDRKDELQKMKRNHTQKKVKEHEQGKEERERKRQKELDKEKKKKEDMQKYVAQQKIKLKQKKQREEEQKKIREEELKRKKKEDKKVKELFKQQNKQHIEKLKKEFEEKNEDKKKKQEKKSEKQRQQQELYKKVRSKANSNYHKFKQIQNKNSQQIASLFDSTQIQEVFQEFELNLKAIFDFLIKNTYLSLTDRKHNYEITHETWHYFTKIFELSPFILTPNEKTAIFVALTKDKQVIKQYKMGLNYKEFQQALLRIAIKHKSIFNKIADNIKEGINKEPIEEVANYEKDENQFENEGDVNPKTLAFEDEVIQQAYIDYGDITKVTSHTLKGLIYYLKVPKDKPSQEQRFRELLMIKVPGKDQKYEVLKEKLKAEYSLSSTVKKKSKKTTNLSQNIKLQESQVQQGQGHQQNKQKQ